MPGAKKIFHVVSVHDHKGKSLNYESNSEYHNSVPSGAARKVFSAVCRDKTLKGNCNLTVVVKQKNKDKLYSYSVSRSKLDTPKELMGRTIEYGVTCKSNNRNCADGNSADSKSKATASKSKATASKSKATASKSKATTSKANASKSKRK